MIADKLEYLYKYSFIPNIKLVWDFIKSQDLQELPVGHYEIRGKELYAFVECYSPQELKDDIFAIHEHYGDIHIILLGRERMLYCFQGDIQSPANINKEGDVKFFKVNEKSVNTLDLNEGQFAFFPPFSPHKPSLKVHKDNSIVRKLVFKVKMSQ